MNPKIALWLAVSVLFEVVGDVLVKRASMQPSVSAWTFCLAAYGLMLGAWFMAIADAKAITVPGIVWLLAGQVALVAVGCGFFGERLSLVQLIGVGLAMPAIIMLCVT